MKLGDVFRRERERKKIPVDQAASALGVSVKEYEQIECGASPAETWGPKLAQMAVKLEVPTSRLISKNGRSDQAAKVPGQCGMLIRARRQTQGWSVPEFAQTTGLSPGEVSEIENGHSSLETYGPLFLRFAELIQQPVFNLFYPCGIAFQQLDEY